MNVESMRLINYRNYNSINIEFNKNINIFVGKNAQGKTNLIEAIYMSSTGKSFRTSRDREIIKFDKNEAYIGSNIKVGNFDKFIEIKMERDKQKRIRVNKTELKNYKELHTGLGVVVFCPEDLKLVKDGPQERRSFIDMGISQIKPVYNYNISRYYKVLVQRNNLLKSSKFKKELVNILEVFDSQISKIGTSIILERDYYVRELNSICEGTHQKLTYNDEQLELRYSSNVPVMDKVAMEMAYLKLLKSNLSKDIECGTTEIGPHRDDILMYINGKDVKTYGSQGQQRTLVLSVKLAEVELIKKERGIYPIILLDDVFSELDEDRRNYLARSFDKTQTFITVTDAVDIKSMEDYSKSIYYIENGNLIK